MIKHLIGTSLFLIGLGLLIFLGTWQIERLKWKTNIINKLNAEYAQNPKKNIIHFAELTALSQEDTPLRYASIKGYYLPQHSILLGPKTKDSLIGYHIITPLQIKESIILVNRGFIEKKDADVKTPASPEGVITVSGLIRKPDWNRFTPRNSPENNIWIRPDIAQISQAKDLSSVAPVMMYEGAEKWYPRNKHLQYALFWFTLATIWAGFGLCLRLSKRTR